MVDKETTEVVDEIYFELPYGLLGKVFKDYVHWKLEKIFRYREEQTLRAMAR